MDDLYTPSEVSKGYHLLPSPQRSAVNAETDKEFFRRHPGAPKKLDWRVASHRRLIRDWLRTRDAVMTQGRASSISLPSPAVAANAGLTTPWTTAGAVGLDQPVPAMSSEQKIEQTILRGLPLLPEDVADEILEMLTPGALAVMVGVLVVWAGSHFFGIGEAADVILLVAGAIALGGAAVSAGRELYAFAHGALDAKTEHDLDVAGAHFAKAVSIIGVQVVLAILLKKAPKAFGRGRAQIGPALPRPPGKMFYRPTVSLDPALPAGEGATSWWGDIKISSAGSAADQQLAVLHEKVHSFLTPKLYFLRNIRANLRANAYVKSVFMRYLEEALAETVAQVGVKGFRGVIEGIKFPVGATKGYNVTLAKTGTEAKGILLGPVNVGAMVYHAFLQMGHEKHQ